MRVLKNDKISERFKRRFHVLGRFFEVAQILGLRNADTWRIFKPPFPGWDIGCYYCDLYEPAERARFCDHGKKRGYEKCGLVINESKHPIQGERSDTLE